MNDVNMMPLGTFGYVGTFVVCRVTSVGFQQACHSDCLSWGRDPCESCFSSSLLDPSADGDPHPRWPTHQNKRDRSSWFSDKHHSLSLLSEGQGAWRFISRGSPPLSPSTSPPPHPTGAAKSKCQSRRRRCIPSRGQLVVATDRSVACLRRRLKKKNIPKKYYIYFHGVKQNHTG